MREPNTVNPERISELKSLLKERNSAPISARILVNCPRMLVKTSATKPNIAVPKTPMSVHACGSFKPITSLSSLVCGQNASQTSELAPRKK
jgi:hypothetical protein